MTDPTPSDRRSPLEHERDAGVNASPKAALLFLTAVIDCNASHILRLPGTGDTIQMGDLLDQVEAISAAPEAERDARGSELPDGRWICSDDCWMAATGETILPPTLAEAMTVPEVAALVHAAERVIARYTTWNGDRMDPAMRNLRDAVAAVRQADGGK